MIFIILSLFGVYWLWVFIGFVLSFFKAISPDKFLFIKRKFSPKKLEKLHRKLNVDIGGRLNAGDIKSAIALMLSNNLINALLFWMMPGLLFFVYILAAYTGFSQGTFIRFSPMRNRSLTLMILEFGGYLTCASIGTRIGSALFFNYNLDLLLIDLTYSSPIALALLTMASIYEINTFTYLLKNIPSRV
ncbi:MAG: hypothetical protein QW717_00530 [Candidatus Bathyarchaeia archaeon]